MSPLGRAFLEGILLDPDGSYRGCSINFLRTLFRDTEALNYANTLLLMSSLPEWLPRES